MSAKLYRCSPIRARGTLACRKNKRVCRLALMTRANFVVCPDSSAKYRHDVRNTLGKKTFMGRTSTGSLVFELQYTRRSKNQNNRFVSLPTQDSSLAAAGTIDAVECKSNEKHRADQARVSELEHENLNKNTSETNRARRSHLRGCSLRGGF